MEVEQAAAPVPSVEPTIIEEDEEPNQAQQPAAAIPPAMSEQNSIQESGKNLDAALANVEDKKSKIAAVGANKKAVPPPAAPKGKKAPVATGKKGFGGKKKGASGQSSSSGANDGSKGHSGSKVAGEVISEEANEDEKPTDLLPGGIEAVEDPDVKLIEEFHRKTETEILKWENLLDISGSSISKM